jgi:uncharacterized membrane protein
MGPTRVLLLAFLIGVISGVRSLTAPAAVALAAHRNWLNLHNTPLSFMASTAAVAVFALAAAVELFADKLPSTPSRLKPPGLIARIVLGALSGGGIAVAGGQTIIVGTVLGVVGGVADAFAGYQVRTRLVKALQVRDLVIALLEDSLAIAGGLLNCVAVLKPYGSTNDSLCNSGAEISSVSVSDTRVLIQVHQS